MTIEEMGNMFESADEFNTTTGCRDLSAFNILYNLVPTTTRMVECAEHDQIWLGVNVEKLAAVISQDQIKELINCGIFWDSDNEVLTMYR